MSRWESEEPKPANGRQVVLCLFVIAVVAWVAFIMTRHHRSAAYFASEHYQESGR